MECFLFRHIYFFLFSLHCAQKNLERVVLPPLGPQRSISITLLETNETLTKDLIFTRALKSLKEQYDEAYSSREDLLSSCTVSGQVRSFLQQKFESLRHQIGDTAVDMARLERNARQDAKVKSALAKRIHALEQALDVRTSFALFAFSPCLCRFSFEHSNQSRHRARHLSINQADERARDQYLTRTDREARELDAQIKSLEEIQEAAYAEMEAELQQLKAEKKLLIKEVKTLRADATTVQAECDQTEQRLKQYREVLQGLLRM